MSLFSETLIFLRVRAGLSREEFASEIGVSVSHIKRLETEYIAPDEKTMNKIAEYFSVTPSYLLGSSPRPDMVSEPPFDLSRKFISIPVLSPSNATKNKLRESEIIEQIVIPTPRNRYCDHIAVLIEDDESCCGRIQKGDVAIIELSNQIPNDSLVAISYKGGPVFFKYYSRLGPTVILSDDKGIGTTIYDIGCLDYNVLGRVISFNAKI